MKRGILLFSGLAIALMLSCKKMGFDKIAYGSWNPNLAIPLAYGTFDIYDIFTYHDTTDLVVIDPNTGLIALIYRSDLIVATAGEIVQLNQFNQNLLVDPSELNAPISGAFNGSITLNNQEDLFLDVNAGVEIHSIHAKSGNLSITVSTNLQHSITSVITLPGVTINGNPVQQTLQLNYQGTVPHTATATFNITGALLDCTVGNTTVNTLKVNIQNTITGSGAPINGNESVNVNITSINMAFEKVYGYFGQQTFVDLQDSVLIKLFENGEGTGYFELVNPSLKLFVENSLGIPVRLNLANLRTINTFTNQEFLMTNYPDIHDINFPAILGVVVQTLIEFNTTNTPNLVNVIAPVPQYLAFSLTAVTNVNGPSATLNFLSDTSKVKVRSELEMPLVGFAYGFGAKDTFAFNLGVDAETIESVMFRLIIDNGFPVKLNAQITFMDENYVPLFTVWEEPVQAVNAALTNAEGVVYQRTVKITDAIVGEENLDLLQQAKFIEIRGTAKTLEALNGNVVKVFDWYTIKVKLGMQIQGKINF